MLDTLAPDFLPEPGDLTFTLSAAAETERLLYTRAEAARQLSISLRSIDYLISNRKITTRRIGRKVLVPRAELIRFARGNHTDDIRPAFIN